MTSNYTPQRIETYYQALLEASTDAIFIETLDGRIVDCNRAACEIYGYPREELLNIKVIDLVSAESLTALYNVAEELPRMGRVEMEAFNRRKDGSLFPAQVTAQMVKGETQHLVVVFVRDLSEWRKNQANLLEMESQLRQRAEALALLHEISLKITAMQNLPDLLQKIVQQAALLLGASSGGLYLCDEATRTVVCQVSYNTPRDYTGTVLNYNEGVAGYVVEHGEPIIIQDYRTWSDRAAVFEADQPFQAVIAAPIIWQEGVIGSINIMDNAQRNFTDQDLELLILVANQAAIAIVNARLFSQATTERRHLSLLYEISQEVSRSLDADEIMNRALKATCESLGGLLGEIFLYFPEQNRLKLSAIYGAYEVSMAEGDRILAMAPGKGLTGWVALHRQPAFAPDVNLDERWQFFPKLDEHIQSSVLAPLQDGDQLLGVITVMHHQRNAFTIEHQNLLHAISQEVSLALSNARRYQEIQRRLAEITLIHKLAQTFNQRLTVQELLDEVVRQLHEQLGYPNIMIHMVKDQILVLVAHCGPVPEEIELPISAGVIGRVARTGKIALVQDVTQDPDYYPCSVNSVAELAVPIFVHGQVAGILNIQSEEQDQLGLPDKNLLEVLAGQISIALENALLYEQIQRHADELELIVAQRTSELTELYQLSQEIGYAIDYEDLMNLLLRRLRKAMRSEISFGLLVNEEHLICTVETDRPLSLAVESHIRSILRRSLEQTEWKMQAGLEQLNLNIQPGETFKACAPEIESIPAVIQSPILIGGKLAGILAAANETVAPFSLEQERLLTTFAMQASTAAQHLATVLSAQQQQLENLVSHLPMGVLLLDDGFNILAANPRGRNLLKILNPEANSESQLLTRLGNRTLHDLIAQADSPLPVEIVLEAPRRQIFTAQARAAFTAGRTERRQWVLTIQDITQERENQERIQIQERLATVGQLAAGIAHDFNNIMAAILVYTDLLRVEEILSPDGQDRLTIIQNQIERAASLIRQILDFSRQSVIERVLLDLLPLIKELDKMLARLLPETIRLELSYHPGEYWIEGDPTRLQQVFINLALNARDAMPNGGKLILSIQKYHHDKDDQRPPIAGLPPGDWIQVSVSDTGIGIPSEIRHRIFEPFFTTKPTGQGTGLGLAQVYGIVQQHQGYIDIQSKINQGTIFHIFFPALQIPQKQEMPQDRLDEPFTVRGIKVLVVEDDLLTCDAIRALLETQGFEVAVAFNGRQALEMIGEGTPVFELIVSDVVMPDIGGLELYQELSQRYPGLSFLLITGYPLGEENTTTLAKRSVTWLQKPFTVPQFTRAVVQALSGKSN